MWLFRLLDRKKCFVTFLAGMQFVTSVDQTVSLHVARLKKCLVTFLAGMWFLPSADPNVFLQVPRLSESLIAFLTGIWFLPSMDSLVYIQPTRCGKNLVTFLAEQWRHCTSDFHDCSLLCNWGSDNSLTFNQGKDQLVTLSGVLILNYINPSLTLTPIKFQKS